MYTLDEMSMLSMRMFFNSLTYQANKLLEKVIVNLCCSCPFIAVLILGPWALIILEKSIMFSECLEKQFHVLSSA